MAIASVRPNFADNRLIAPDNVDHAFSMASNRPAERGFTGKVIKEAVFNHRSDGHLRAGK